MNFKLSEERRIHSKELKRIPKKTKTMELISYQIITFNATFKNMQFPIEERRKRIDVNSLFDGF